MNGLQVSDVIPIKAMTAIDNSLLYGSTTTNVMLKEQEIKVKLAYEMASELHHFMTINKYEDIKTMRQVYEGTVHMAVVRQPLNPSTPLPSIVTSPFNGTSIATKNTTANSVYISPTSTAPMKEYDKLRVCEYTLDGKITRVELQRYENGMWMKIPRVQIEE